VTEAVNRSAEPFGLARLDAALGDPSATAAEVVKSAISALDDFAAGLDPADDRTLVVVRRA
jgi:hypothetical protein